jgi:membrane-associated phospholipid phosphatase
MAINADGDRTEVRIGESAARWGGGRLLVLRRNTELSRSLASRRRRDTRFRLVPYGGFELVNFATIFLTALALAAVMLDPYLTVWHAHLPPRLVDLFRTVTRFGKSDWILVSTGLFFLAMLMLDASALKARLRVRRAMRTLAAGYVFAAVALAGIIANLSKSIIGRARPKHFDETGSLSFDFWSGDSSWASFPSGHATTAMALGVALALLFPRLRWVFLCLCFWIAVSRLFVEAHYPSDVIAGGMLGSVMAWLMARALARRRLVFGFGHDGQLVRRKGASGRLF